MQGTMLLISKLLYLIVEASQNCWKPVMFVEFRTPNLNLWQEARIQGFFSSQLNLYPLIPKFYYVFSPFLTYLFSLVFEAYLS